MEISILLNNQYRIDTSPVAQLGHGGMSAIHPGVDEESGEEVAGKTLLGEYQADRSRRARFQVEAGILEQLDSPHIVQWLAWVDDRHGPWLVMERLRGRTLSEALEDGEPISVREVAGLITQAAAALDHMHAKRLVHLDVKPGNLFLTDDGELKLIDFGIAQHMGPVRRATGGGIIGTAAYISPEHMAGGVVSAASDVYALGCVAYELLTGQKPFSDRTDLATVPRRTLRTTEMPAPASSVAPGRKLPAWVDDLLARALQVDPAMRYASAGEFAEAFHEGAYAGSFRIRRRVRPQPPVAKTEVAGTQVQAAPVIQVRDRPAEPEAPSRISRWWSREMRNARRVLMVFALLVAMVLSFPLYAPPITDWALGVLPGVNTTVMTDRLNLRAGPSTESSVVTVLTDDQRVRVTGLPESTGPGGVWWPITVEVDGTRYQGWVADAYIDHTWLMQRGVSVVNVSDDMRDWWSWLDPVLPGVVLYPRLS